MFSKSAHIYDEIYTSLGKDYQVEAEKVHSLIQQHKSSKGNLLLDVACGTGLHIDHLRKHYQVEGLDLDPGMLDIAHSKFPEITFHHADMVDFKLSHQFDATTCLFSSIGYVKTKEKLQQALQNMQNYLIQGGVLIIEPWFTPEQWHPGSPHATFVDKPDLKIARMNVSEVDGRLSSFTFHYLVAASEGIKYFTERHELGLFTHEEYLQALQLAGLVVHHDPEGLYGRGLYIGIKS